MTGAAPRTILIVDDDPQIRKLLGAILKRDGYGIITAANGRQALQELDKQAVDLVITDLLMPEKEGIETIMEIRHKFTGMPIIAISGGGRLNPQTYLKIAKSLGAVRTMTKPIDTAMLRAMAKDLLVDSGQDT
jgi:DNA-binding response OmpR family regulator